MGIAAGLAFAPAALATQVHVTLVEVRAADTKSNGAPWDALGDAPEIAGSMVLGAGGSKGTTARFEVRDEDGRDDEAIDGDVQTVDALRAAAVTKLAFGGVERLVVEARTVRESPTADMKEFVLEAGTRWLDTGIAVHAGQTLRVSAAGLQCFEGRCFGPDGDAGLVERVDPVIRGGELAVSIGRWIHPVGAARQLRTPTSGRLWIGRASRTASTGSMRVMVEVYYPVRG